MANTYVTTQGDTWDLISFKIYGTEKYASVLIELNPDYVNTSIFSANAVLTYQDIQIEQKISDNAPPWKRKSAAPAQTVSAQVTIGDTVTSTPNPTQPPTEPPVGAQKFKMHTDRRMEIIEGNKCRLSFIPLGDIVYGTARIINQIDNTLEDEDDNALIEIDNGVAWVILSDQVEDYQSRCVTVSYIREITV